MTNKCQCCGQRMIDDIKIGNVCDPKPTCTVIRGTGDYNIRPDCLIILA
jgi:hypothetical protein